MYYLYDNSHYSKSKTRKAKILKLLENVAEIEIFLEGVTFDGKEKKKGQRIWNEFVAGHGKLNRNNIEAGSGRLTLDPVDTELAECILRNRGKVKRVDTGPVFPEDMKEAHKKVQKAQKSGSVDTNLLIQYVAERDWRTAQYISNRCHDSKKTLVIMGAQHALDKVLEQKYSLERLNRPKIDEENLELREHIFHHLQDEGKI